MITSTLEQEQSTDYGHRLDVIQSWIGSVLQSSHSKEDLHDEALRLMHYPLSPQAVDAFFARSRPANLPSLFYGVIEELPQR